MQNPFLGARSQNFQLADSFTSQSIHFAHRQNDFTFQKVFQLAKLEWCSTEATKLFPQKFSGERALFRFNQRHGGIFLNYIPQFITHNEREWQIRTPMNFNLNWSLKIWLFS